jgi:hypothetical protein
MQKYAAYKSQGWRDNRINPTGKFVIRKHSKELYAFQDDWYTDTLEIRRDEFTLLFNVWKHSIKLNVIPSMLIFSNFKISWHKASPGHNYKGFSAIMSQDKLDFFEKTKKYTVLNYFFIYSQIITFAFVSLFYTLFF